MPLLALRYDMRAPAFGAPVDALYRAALEQCRWADRLGFDEVVISEHHATDDGYCPSPLVLAAAMGATTSRLRVMVSAVILPLHDPVRVAEDVAVADLACGGRLDVIVVAGYRPNESAMFGRSMAGRARAVEDGVDALKRAWTGEPFELDGRPVRVTPRPAQRPHPPLLLGGGTPTAARRAARLGDGYMPPFPRPDLYDAYLAERERLGLGPGRLVHPAGPLGVIVSEDPEKAWPVVGPHLLHEARSYGQWENERPGANSYPLLPDWESLRESGFYAVVSPDECVTLWRSLDDQTALLLHPLVGGLAPEEGWKSLRAFEHEVLPRLSRVGR